MTDALRRLAIAAYALALYQVISPLLDVATSVWPFNLGDERWRYSLAGFTSNYLVSVLFGMLLAALVAAAAQHRVVLRIVCILSGLGALVMALMSLGLLLDALQLFRLVNREDLAMFRIGVSKTGFKLVAEAVLFVLIFLGCFKALRDLSPSRVRVRVA